MWSRVPYIIRHNSKNMKYSLKTKISKHLGFHTFINHFKHPAPLFTVWHLICTWLTGLYNSPTTTMLYLSLLKAVQLSQSHSVIRFSLQTSGVIQTIPLLSGSITPIHMEGTSEQTLHKNQLIYFDILFQCLITITVRCPFCWSQPFFHLP